MQLGGVNVDAGRIARAQRVAEGGEAGFDRRQTGFEACRVDGSLERSHQPFTLVRSSWALAISLSAIASGLILKLPSAIAAPMRATLSASNSLAAPAESSVDAALERATVALASTSVAPVACPGAAFAASAGAAGVPTAGASSGLSAG